LWVLAPLREDVFRVGLIGDTDTTHVLLQAEGAESSLKLTNKDGKQQLIKP